MVNSQFYSRIKELNYFAVFLDTAQLYRKRRHYYFHCNSSCVIILWSNVGWHNGLDLSGALGKFTKTNEISGFKWGKEFVDYQRNNSFSKRKFSVELLHTRTVYIIRHILRLYIIKLKNFTYGGCVTIKILLTVRLTTHHSFVITSHSALSHLHFFPSVYESRVFPTFIPVCERNQNHRYA